MAARRKSRARPGPKEARSHTAQPPRPSEAPSAPPSRGGLGPYSFAALALALALYLAQVPPASGEKDGSEFTLVLATLGVAHPTGYPLYTLLGHLFASAVHALGAGWPWAANVWSAAGGAVAILFLHALSMELIPTVAIPSARGRAALAALPTALFGLAPMWTYEATLGEVYSWHLAWTMAASFWFARTQRALGNPSSPWGRREAGRAALAWGALAGLGVSHHLTSTLTLLPLTAALVWSARRRASLGLREIGLGLGAAALPLLSSWAYLLVRAGHPTAHLWPDLTPGLGPAWAHLTGSFYHGRLGSFAPSAEQREMLAASVYPVLAPSLLLSGLALFAARGREEGRVLGPLWAAALTGTAFAFSYGVPDPSSYFMAPLALSAAGLVPLGATLWRSMPAGVVAAALGVTGLSAVWTHAGLSRKAQLTQYDRELHEHWASIPVEEGFVIWPSDTYARFLEYQRLRGEKPRLEVINPAFLLRSPGRERFQARHGFDPAAGLGRWQPPPGYPFSLSDPEDLVAEQMGRWINQHSPLPVVLLDVRATSLRQLRKP
jgi:hypothetical protein